MTKEQILSQLLSNISDEYDKDVGSFFYDVEMPVAIVLEDIYLKLDAILKNGFALTAEGTYLDTKVLEQGLRRKSPTFSTLVVNIKGEPKSPINIGDKVGSDTLTFSSTESKVVGEDGSVNVLFKCDTPGSIGNVPKGTINRFPVTLPGLISATNNLPAKGGFDAESDDELRERYFEKVSLPAASGSKYHYVMWAKEVDGVGDAKCIPLWNGNGTVKVVIINSDKGVADAKLIETVSNHIEEQRPIGASVTVESAAPLVIDVSVKLVLAEGITTEVGKQKIEESITTYLQKGAFVRTEISYAQIGGCILNCPEILDYSDLKVNNATANIPIGETEVPVLGVVTIAQ